MRTIALAIFLSWTSLLHAADQPGAKPPVGQGRRVFSAGHSFHVFLPVPLRELAQAAGFKDHDQLGVQSLGGSRVLQHWNLPDEKNQAKQALGTGKVDVLTLSPIFLPDEGIDLFAKLALEHNPDVHITVQAFWLPFDVYDVNYQKKKPEKVDRNTRTGDDLRKIHAEYFQSVEQQVKTLNQKYGKQVLYVVPVGQAVIALREKIIAGQAPGLKTQDELFSDAIGHARPPLQALAAYCHFAVIYRRSPVGIPMPSLLLKAKNPAWDDKLNRLLQELAWQAVIQQPLSGVQASP